MNFLKSLVILQLHIVYNQNETKHVQEDNKMATENNEKERQKMTITSGTSAEGVLMTDGKGGYYRQGWQPGRELDAKVYEATGHTWFECWNYEDVYDDELGEVVRYEPLEVLEEVPHYSTSITAAWQLVELAGLTVIRVDDGEWMAGRAGNGEYRYVYNNGVDNMVELAFPSGFKLADTAPHAICLAYLALVENESGVKG